MGTTVTINLDDQQKPDYLIAVEDAGAVVVGAGQLIIWIGNDTPLPKSFEINGTVRCMELIKENGNKTPIGANISFAMLAQPGNKVDAVKGFDVPAVAPVEGSVGIFYGSAFQPSPGSSVASHAKRALESFRENAQSVA